MTLAAVTAPPLGSLTKPSSAPSVALLCANAGETPALLNGAAPAARMIVVWCYCQPAEHVHDTSTRDPDTENNGR